MHEETLAQPTRRLFDKLSSFPWILDFYLAGGTGLSLSLGHRVSVDLDFFSEKEFDEPALVDHLRAVGKLEILHKAPQSLTGTLDAVKFSFLRYSYPLLAPGTVWRSITVASVEDIACMKLDALSSRGTKRDFIDVYIAAQRIAMAELLKSFERKYSSVKYNLMHVKKSLTYFDDAEGDPMPDMIAQVTWGEVKEFFQEEAVRL